MKFYKMAPEDINLVLDVEQLEKQFTLHTQNGAVLDVLDKVNLTVSAGEIIALCGPSGAGKSSLLKSVYGTYRVSGGKINILSEHGMIDIAKAEPREIIELRTRTIGYVSQFLRVIPRVSTLDIVANAAIETGTPEDEAKSLAVSLLEKLRIPAALHDLSPLTFSGGEQQRVNIARAMSAPRPLMLFDEPTASLDPVNRETVLSMIRELAASGTAVLGIFHDPKDREKLRTRDFDLKEAREPEDA
ncbi:MAG: phosphonate C-P lyase system protein PhnL [Pseudomonadota bacterium]